MHESSALISSVLTSDLFSLHNVEQGIWTQPSHSDLKVYVGQQMAQSVTQKA